MSKTKSNQNLITVNSLEEAEKQVYKLIQANKNPREISQIGFSINGVVKRFNPVQIREIKAKFEPKIPENNRDQDKSRVFSLFKKNKKPVDVIIQTGLNYEYVKKSYDEFLEFEENTIVPKYWLDNLEEFADYVTDPDGPNKLGHIHCAFSVAKESHIELQKHFFYCCKCGEEIRIRENTLEAAHNFLSSKWGHSECINFDQVKDMKSIFVTQE